MKPGNPVIAFFLTLLTTTAFSQSAPAPLSRSEILGRLALGRPPSEIARLIKIRGLASSASDQFLSDVERAGGRGILIEKLSTSVPSGLPASSPKTEQNLDHFANCAALLHIGNAKEAVPECRASIDEDSQSPWPLLVTSQILMTVDPEDQDAGTLARRALELASIPVSSDVGSDEISPVVANALIAGIPGGGPGSVRLIAAEDSSELGPMQTSGNDADLLGPDLTQMLADDPDLSATHMLVAERFGEAGKFEQCTTEFNEAVRLDPDDPGIHTSIARLYLLQGNFEAQISELRESVRIVPYGFDQRVDLARALEDQGRTDEAIAEWRDLLDKVPDSALAKNELAWIYATSSDPRYRNPGEALTLATEAVQLSNESASAILDTLAEALLINGLPDEALEIEEKALQLDLDNFQINDRMKRFQAAAHQNTPPEPE
jgi:tetratricopeptide (TPR) repeat protein